MKVFRADLTWDINEIDYKGEVKKFVEASDLNIVLDEVRTSLLDDRASKSRGPVITIKVIEDAY